MSRDFVIALFYYIDEFCIKFEPMFNKILLPNRRKTRMSLSELMTIVVLFHLSKFRTFKDFYISGILQGNAPGVLKGDFRYLSYTRFVSLMPRTVFPLFCYLSSLLKPSTGLSFIDSTILTVCHIRRASSHKTFKEIASKSKTSTGWFFGLKLHLVINEHGQLQAFQLTSGSTHDLIPVESLTKKLVGYLFGDKAYLSKNLFQKLYQHGLKLITKIRSNMKNVLMDPWEKLMLRARGVIESVNDRLKNGVSNRASSPSITKKFFCQFIRRFGCISTIA